MKNLLPVFALILAVFFAAMIVATAGGYFANIYRLVKDDFSPPYKAEILRGVGIVVPFIGAIEGYMTFDEETKNRKETK